MALTGLQIYKLLPKTNCKKCGFPTCLAFAMKLSQKGIELSACPDVSEEAKAALEAASQPPVRLVTVGAGEKAFAVCVRTDSSKRLAASRSDAVSASFNGDTACRDPISVKLEKVSGAVDGFAGLSLLRAGTAP